jgi:hypothetical protein
VAPAAPAATAMPTTDACTRAAVGCEARPRRDGPMGTPVMDGEDLHVFVIAAPVDLQIFNPQIWEMDVLIEVRELVFDSPLFDFLRVTIRVSVVIRRDPDRARGATAGIRA